MAPQINIQSQLMKNHVAGQVLPAQRHLALARGIDGIPLLFSLNDANQFMVSIPSDANTVGWVQVDLGAQIQSKLDGVDTSVVETFALSQSPDGLIWLSVAVSNSKQAGSRVFVSHAFQSDLTIEEWKDFGSKLIERPLPEQIDVVSLALGVGDGSTPVPLLVFAGTNPSGEMRHYQVNPDPADPSWVAKPLIFPQNATRCLAALPGYIAAHGVGVYALCEVGQRRSLTFTPLPQYYNGHPVTKPPVELELPANANPTTIATVPLADLQTELYLGGSGLWRYDLAAQATSNLRGTEIEDGTYFDEVHQLCVRRDKTSGLVSIWAKTNADVLMYTRGIVSDAETHSWQTPVPLDVEVTALDAFLVSETDQAESSIISAMGFSDGSLAIRTQDPLTKLWRKQSVFTHKTDSAVEINTYTTRITVQDDNGVPLAEEAIQIEPSFDCTARVNGQYHVLRVGVPKPVTTNGAGVVTVVLQTEALEAPVYTVSISDVVNLENPTKHVRDQLANYQQASDIENARRSDGTLVFPNGVNKDSAQAAATALGHLVKAYDSLPASGASRASEVKAMLTQAEPVRKVLLAVATTDSGGTMLSAPAGEARFAQLGSDSILVTAGDLFAALYSGVESIGNFFINEVNGLYEFVVDLGDKLLRFVFEVGTQVFNAVSWILKQLLGVDIDDLMDWLGFVFDWDAILQTHRVLHKLVNLNLDYGKAQLEKIKSIADEAFQKAREQIKKDGGITVDTSNEIFQKRLKETTSENTKNSSDPQSSWALDHFSAGVESATTSPVNIIYSFIDEIEKLANTEGEILNNTLNQIVEDLINEFDSLTWAQIITKLLAIVEESLLNTVENVSLTLIDILEIVIDEIRKILNAHWDIPVLTYVYEKIICQDDGSKLTLLDLVCLIAAVPTTITYRAVTGQPIFSASTVRMIEEAKTLEEAVVAFRSMSIPTLQTSPHTARLAEISPAEGGFLFLQALAFPLRGDAAVCFGSIQLSSKTPWFKQRFAEAKLALDILISIAGTAATLMLGFEEKWSLSKRVWYDNAITWSTWLFRIKDAILVLYWRKKGHEAKDPLKIGLACVEGGLGVFYVILVTLSAMEQARELAPSFHKQKCKEHWKDAFVLKVAQNGSNAIYRVLAPASYIPKIEKAARAVRFILLVTTAGCSLQRFIYEAECGFTDLDF